MSDSAKTILNERRAAVRTITVVTTTNVVTEPHGRPHPIGTTLEMAEADALQLLALGWVLRPGAPSPQASGTTLNVQPKAKQHEAGFAGLAWIPGLLTR